MLLSEAHYSTLNLNSGTTSQVSLEPFSKSRYELREPDVLQLFEVSSCVNGDSKTPNGKKNQDKKARPHDWLTLLLREAVGLCCSFTR